MKKLTHKRLLSLLKYDHETGHWEWYKPKPPLMIKKAGSYGPKGYYQVKVDSVSYRAHRLAWFYMTGEWPKHQIDHINRIRDDNRWVNLRDVTPQQNSRNSHVKIGVSGHRGVRVHLKKFTAGIYDKDGTTIYLGIFDKKEQAAEAWLRAYKQLFGPPDYTAASSYVQGMM